MVADDPKGTDFDYLLTNRMSNVPPIQNKVTLTHYLPLDFFV